MFNDDVSYREPIIPDRENDKCKKKETTEREEERKVCWVDLLIWSIDIEYNKRLDCWRPCFEAVLTGGSTK